MQDAETLVYKALNEPTLLNLLGGQVKSKGWMRIYNSPDAKDPEEFPRLNLFEAANSDTESADDEPQTSDVNIRLELRTTDESKIFDIKKQIKKNLNSAFSRCRVEIGSKQTDVIEGIKIYFVPINVFLLLKQGE